MKYIKIIFCLITFSIFLSCSQDNKYNIEILHTIRNPLSAISSPVKNWLNYKNGKNFGPVAFFFHFNLVLRGINDLQNTKKKNKNSTIRKSA